MVEIIYYTIATVTLLSIFVFLFFNQMKSNQKVVIPGNCTECKYYNAYWCGCLSRIGELPKPYDPECTRCEFWTEKGKKD